MASIHKRKNNKGKLTYQVHIRLQGVAVSDLGEIDFKAAYLK